MSENIFDRNLLYIGDFTEDVVDKIKRGELRPQPGQYFSYADDGKLTVVSIGPGNLDEAVNIITNNRTKSTLNNSEEIIFPDELSDVRYRTLKEEYI